MDALNSNPPRDVHTNQTSPCPFRRKISKLRLSRGKKRLLFFHSISREPYFSMFFPNRSSLQTWMILFLFGVMLAGLGLTDYCSTNLDVSNKSQFSKAGFLAFLFLNKWHFQCFFFFFLKSKVSTETLGRSLRSPCPPLREEAPKRFPSPASTPISPSECLFQVKSTFMFFQMIKLH